MTDSEETEKQAQFKERHPKLFCRIGIAAEKVIFEDNQELFDGFIMPAHIGAYYEATYPTYMRRIRKPYFIDPMTYVFAQNRELVLSSGNLRNSFEKLLKKYGGEFERLARHGTLSKSDFLEDDSWKDDLLDGLATSVLEYQRDFTKVKEGAQKSLKKYSDFLKRKVEKALPPRFLVPPYFYGEDIGDWKYRLSVELARRSDERKKEGEVIYPIVCVSQAALDEDSVRRIVSDYRGYHGHVIWISRFFENRVDILSLKGYARIVKSLAAIGSEVLSLYGGFYAALLSKVGLAGFGCGLSYGGAKDVEPIPPTGGGQKRYYVPILHNIIGPSRAAALFPDHPNLICRKCPECIETIGNLGVEVGEKPTGDVVGTFIKEVSTKTLKEHFLRSRNRELAMINEKTTEEIEKVLESDYERCKRWKLDPRYKIKVDYLDNWRKAMSSFKDIQSVSPIVTS